MINTVTELVHINKGTSMKKQIIIKVYPNGKIESETVGIKGKNCFGYIKDIEQLTGATVMDSHFTEEYYQRDTTNNTYNEAEQKRGY